MTTPKEPAPCVQWQRYVEGCWLQSCRMMRMFSLRLCVEWRLFTLFGWMLLMPLSLPPSHFRSVVGCYCLKSQHVYIEITAKRRVCVCFFTRLFCFAARIDRGKKFTMHKQWKSFSFVVAVISISETMHNISAYAYILKLDATDIFHTIKQPKQTSSQTGRKESWIIVYFALKLN